MKRYIKSTLNFSNLDRAARGSTAQHLGKLMDDQEDLANDDYIESSVRFLEQQLYMKCKDFKEDFYAFISSVNSDIDDAMTKYNIGECGLGDMIAEEFANIDLIVNDYYDALVGQSDPLNGVYVVLENQTEDEYIYLELETDIDNDGYSNYLDMPIMDFMNWVRDLVFVYCDLYGNPTNPSDDTAVKYIADTISSSLNIAKEGIAEAVERAIEKCIKQNPPALQ